MLIEGSQKHVTFQLEHYVGGVNFTYFLNNGLMTLKLSNNSQFHFLH